MAETATKTTDKIQQVNGTPQMGKQETIKLDEVMKFARGKIFHALRITQDWNVKKGEYDEPAPKQTVMIDGKFVDFPVDDPDTTEAYGEFLVKYAKVTRGLKMKTRDGTVIDDVKEAMKLTEAFRS